MTSPVQIVILHGALGSSAQMEPVAAALGALGIVHNIELPGHGNTPLADGEAFSIEAFARSLRQSLETRGLGIADTPIRPVVFGYSMGGYVALALEASAPGTFAGVVTLGTKFAWTPVLAQRELSRLDASTIQEKIPKFASVLEARHASSGGWHLMLERTATLLTSLGDEPVLTETTLREVRAPVIIAVGERDDTVNVEEASHYAAFIPRANTRVITDAPHPIERVPVEEIVALLREILDR